MKKEIITFRIAKKIDNYNQKGDGCYWSHILDCVEEAFDKGIKFGEKKNG